MKLPIGVLAAVLTVTFSSPAIIAADKDPMLKVIKARKAEMVLRSWNAGPLFAMAKGEKDYDAESAASLANNLQLLLSMDNGAMWPQGSDNQAYEGKTRALPEIWTTYPAIADAGKVYAEAVNGLATEAGNGLDALRSKVGALGKSCKGCHTDFRAKKN